MDGSANSGTCRVSSDSGDAMYLKVPWAFVGYHQQGSLLRSFDSAYDNIGEKPVESSLFGQIRRGLGPLRFDSRVELVPRLVEVPISDVLPS